jgi:hypothetical protein|tara:strand:- start:4097 stop:4249 length:153 start_codon:yes stop_codon:yes gene_type:complete
MGKGFVWLGNKIIALNCVVVCKWNKLMLALMLALTITTKECPSKICTCKK